VTCKLYGRRISMMSRVICYKENVIALKSHNCLVKAHNRLVAVLGVEGLAVIETKDSVLVVPLDKVRKSKTWLDY
jgi:mannose-1-phosphate guanylyltransferase